MAGSGLATAVALAGGAGDAPGGEQQEELFADVVDDVALPTRARSGPKGGRPAGARNRSTEQWRQFFLSRYASPLIGLGELYSRTPEELARELRLFCHDVDTGAVIRDRDGRERLLPDALLTAIKLQLDARSAALPYLHQRQPQAIELPPGRQLGVLVIGSLDTPAAGAGDQLPLAPSEVNQRVIDVTPSRSDGDGSDAGAKPNHVNGIAAAGS